MTCNINFANYKLNCGNGNYCTCDGPCRRNSDVCNYNGYCLNQVAGSTCVCYEHTFYQYTGKHCQTFIRNSRFYGVLFGVLAAGLLLLLVIIIAVIFCCRRKRSRGTDRRSSLKWYSIDEEYFRFPQTDLTTATPTRNDGKPLGKRRGKYSLDEHQTFEDELGSGVWRPNLDEVDTEAEIRAERPEMVMPSSGER
ncbi:mucin-17 [Rhincodon typus]|uniref:mucin-17 n=1 Tax=Rhincodon typus TaxID=259920 RepID=UPI00202FCB04|nr:mucin-17 [Rhincodon typus]